MSESTAQQREIWKQFECNPGAMTVIDFGPDRIQVAPPAVDAFHALASALLSHGYQIRVDDTDSYCCRAIKGGTGHSLHSFGIAIDVNWDTNPFKETPDGREVRFSDKATQQERAQDVKLGHADTDMTPEMINDVRAIKTNNAKMVFEWGGNWKDRKDTMHFELDVTPADLQTGIDWNTVKKSRDPKATAAAGGSEIQVSNQLETGARGDDVRKLQLSLAQRGYPIGDVDGIYGNQTATAVRAFQASQGLSQTGIADAATLRAVETPAQQIGGTAMKPDDVLRAIFGALLGGQPTGAAAPHPSQAGAASTQDILQLVLNALIASQAGTGSAAKPAAPQARRPPPPLPPRPGLRWCYRPLINGSVEMPWRERRQHWP